MKLTYSEMLGVEMKLIRIGHFLWRWYKADGEPAYLLAACESVWAAKRLFRVELHQASVVYWQDRHAKIAGKQEPELVAT